jgi:two-component system response regulator PilR (NtrC family)
MSGNILIIDDEPDIRGLLSITLERMGHHTVSADNVTSSKNLLKKNNFDLCLTDLKLPDGSGIDIVKDIQQSQPQTPVIVITAHGSMDIAVEAMKCGAFDFINKPVDINHLRTLITSALNTNKTKNEKQAVPDIIGESREALRLKENITKVARSQAPVFICGESGSGKELTAKAIHKLSSRKDKPFIAVNCGAIPKELMESEFFGHTKGSFTGAHQDKPGLFQSAEGGTLFLDEVADLPMDMQVKLLRAIQEKSIRAVGSQKEIKIDVRILSATHKDLQQAIYEGTFRNDLYYRINVIEINVPALRERKEDISLLTNILLEKIAEKNLTTKANINENAIVALSAYDFPGNIRELENILERACALCGDEGITSEDLNLGQSSLGKYNIQDSKYDARSRSTYNSSVTEPQLPQENINSIAQLDYDSKTESIDSYLDNIEKMIILDSLDKHRWNRTTTAKELGITFRSLRYRMKKLGIDDE